MATIRPGQERFLMSSARHHNIMAFGFFKKRSRTPAVSAVTAGMMIAMPEAFYGGKDPIIHFQRAAIESVSAKIAPDGQKHPISARGSVAGLMENKRRLYMIAGAALVVFVAGVSWYYVRQAGRGRMPATSITVAPSPAVEPAATVETSSPPTSSLAGEEETAATTAPLPPSLRPHLGEFPPSISGDATDADADALTDREEEALGTDSLSWDTDSDGYYDGQEVANLYNPSGFAPVKIIDSGLVRDYVNPVWQYRVYYPMEWEVGVADPGGDQVVFGGLSDEFVEVRSFKKDQADSFDVWFAKTVSGQSFGDLSPTINRFGVSMFVRQDGLVAYVPSESAVFVFLYHPGDGNTASYSHILGMMAASMRPATGPQVSLPLQSALPELPGNSL